MKSFFTLILCLLSSICISQTFTKQDTLRGSITPERAWWNLVHYHLEVDVDISEKSIKGKNTVTYEVLSNSTNAMQIDLQKPMVLERAVQDGKDLTIIQEGNAHFITLNKKQVAGVTNTVELYFYGKPQIAKNAPWDGGFSWSKDSNNNPFVATSNQGIGASIWWPNKDHSYDEPDKGVKLSITTPSNLMAVGNGRLEAVEENNDKKTWHWTVVNPINNYGVNINIGDYVHFGEVYNGENGPLDMDYYVLRENKTKAQKQFKQAPKMMEAFEHWLGPYPFYEDSFKLVEVPYLGMEHQSSVTYGNKYLNGYLGNDLSGSGWGLKFDFIIIHEAGHEWFANNITHIDVADMWIHEGFTAYSESLYLDYYYGKQAASDYVIGTRRIIQNDKPLIGIYDVHQEGSSDMYYKGSNLLHTLRQLIEDDEKWRSILRGLNKTFYHQTVSSHDVETYISNETGKDLTAFFNQYLRSVKVPTLEYKIEDNSIEYRYVNIVSGFDMPIQVYINNKEQWLFPTKNWKQLNVKSNKSTFEVKKDFYIDVIQIN